MPSYGFRCLDCGHTFELFISYADYDQHQVLCLACDSSDTQRMVHRVRVAKSDDQRMENLADPEALAGLDEDPRALGKMMRKMSREMGEDMGSEFDEVVDRLEKGQTPDDIERDLPDLGSDNDSPGGLGAF
ncbi:MAG: FmdB family zinc ribbon protein [Chloroflexota bacterium]